MGKRKLKFGNRNCFVFPKIHIFLLTENVYTCSLHININSATVSFYCRIYIQKWNNNLDLAIFYLHLPIFSYHSESNICIAFRSVAAVVGVFRAAAVAV